MGFPAATRDVSYRYTHGMRRLGVGVGAVVGASLSAGVLGGCESSFDRHRDDLILAHARGDFVAAGEMLDQAREAGLYGSRNEVLWLLERGATAVQAGEDELAVDLLNDAEDRTEVYNEQSVADIAGQWLLSERASAYIARPYEEQYINVFKMLALFHEGRLENGPTVEARRLASKGNRLRDRYLGLLEELKRRGATESYEFARPGQFIESPLGVYLSVVAFREQSNEGFASTAIKRLRSSLEAQAGLGIESDASMVDRLASMDASSQDAMFVALGGRGPILGRRQVGPYLIYVTPVYFELPEIVVLGTSAASASVEIELADGSTKRYALDRIEDLGAVSQANHEQTLPLIYARTYLRAMSKSALLTAGGVAVANSSNDSDTRALGVLATMLGGLVYLATTEKADIRCWTMLPGVAWVGVVDLPEGEHRARILFLDDAENTMYAGEWKAVHGGQHGLDTLIETWPG